MHMAQGHNAPFNGVVEIGPVGPVTQKEVAPAQANTSCKRDAAEAAAQPAAAASRCSWPRYCCPRPQRPAASCDSRTTGRQQRALEA
jgi:hypothetical protein